jgi:hypothetical protein
MSDPNLAPWWHRDLIVAPCGPACTGAFCRQVEHAEAVVKAMELEGTDRYIAGTYGIPDTRCNIPLWDYTRNRSFQKPGDCEVPHWVGPDGVEVPDFKGKEQGANLSQQWLDGPMGRLERWSRVSISDVRDAVNVGMLGVVGYLNLGGIGHVGIVLPTRPEDPDLMIAQAGRVNFSRGPLSKGFGHLPVKFWVHD